MKKYNFFTSNVKPQTYTLADFDSAMESMRNQSSEIKPHYSPLSDSAVDEYLKMGIIPKYVIVSSRSFNKIKQYLESAPTAIKESGKR